MVKLFFKIAWRNLIRNKTYSLINITGLAIGLTCFILISLYVTDELSFDRHHEKGDRIYRIHSLIKVGGSELKLAVSSDPMGAALKKDYPQVEQYTRIYGSGGSKVLRKNNDLINEELVAHADSTFFEVFTFPAVNGNTSTALNEPNTVVISEAAAKKYFGTVNAIGKTIEVAGDQPTLYKVSAVIRDMPKNSHFRYDFIFSMDNVDYEFGNYLSHNFHTYLLLKEGTSQAEFEKNFKGYVNKYVLPQAQQVMQIKDMAEFEKSGNRLEYALMPLPDIHLYSDLFPELGVNGNVRYVYIFSAVAIFILLLACINFINLSTARSMKRAREVGVRKVLGTSKLNLIKQFISESTITVLISTLIAVTLSLAVLPAFNELSSKTLDASSLFRSNFPLIIIFLPFIVSILSGLYPAFFLSSFKPIQVLKGKINTGSHKSSLRSGLVIFQFATSIVLIIGTITVFRQLDYIQNKKIGFNKEQVLVLDGTWVLNNNVTAFKNEVLRMPGVISGTFAGFLPVSASSRNDRTYAKESVPTPTNSLNMQTWRIDHDYINTLGMEIIKGRNFSKDFGTDSTALIINETTASLLGFNDPVGKTIYTTEDNDADKVVAHKIIGVVKNFNFESMRQKIAPLCFTLGSSSWSMAFRIRPEKASEVIASIEKQWESMSTGLPFNYRFLDDSFNKMYAAEQRVGRVALTFASLAVIIACLGLFGLATYMAEQRTKEIGVRKVLGASVRHIIVMLSHDFLKLVVIAAFIAFPLAWWSMSAWLQDFEYRVSIGWLVFLLAGVIAVFIALLTISFQALKAALANPVNSLRTE